jgi:glycosyltransferase involved in cell wall biosynthesis
MLSPRATPVVSVTGLDVPKQTWEPSLSDEYIAWIGRYDIHHKGIDYLLAAVKLLEPNERPRIKMRGPDHLGDKVQVEKQIHDLGLEEWVELGGELSPDEAREFLRHSQGFVHVPRWEAFGRTIVEALSLGCPVLLGAEAHIAGILGPAGAARIVTGAEPSSIASGLVELARGAVETGPAGRVWVTQELSWASRAGDLSSQLAAIKITSARSGKPRQ